MIPPRALASPLPGAIDLVDERGVPVLRLSGEIDSTVVAEYEDRPWLATAEPRVIDVSDVTFLDCRGLRFLVRRTQAARSSGCRPELRRPARIVRRVIDVADAGNLFTIIR